MYYSYMLTTIEKVAVCVSRVNIHKGRVNDLVQGVAVARLRLSIFYCTLHGPLASDNVVFMGRQDLF